MIHNGIIENAGRHPEDARAAGATCSSPRPTPRCSRTWSGEFYDGNLEEAVAAALRDVDGAYGLAFISADEPDVLVAARKGSPLLVGVGEDEWFVASDASPLLQHTRSVVYLDDGEMVVLTRDGYRVREPRDRRGSSKPVNQIEWDLAHDRAGRLRPLHAEGDLRAAGEPLRTRSAATCSRTRARRGSAAST